MAILPSLFNPNSPPLEKIFGHIQEYGFVLLDGCQSETNSLNLNYGALRASCVIFASRVFTGFPDFQNDIPLFNTLTFSVEGIDDWVGISGISTINARYRQARDTTTISYKLPETISFDLTEDMQLEVVFTARHPASLSPRDVGITEKTFFRLVSKTPQDFRTFVSVAQKITNLLCFAINETVSLDSMSAGSEELCHNIADNMTVPAEINIYDLSESYSKEQPRIRQDRMLFKFGDIRGNTEGMVNKWLENYERYKDTFTLYFSAQSIPLRILKTKFLSLAQGLEVYHRKTYGEEENEDTIDEVKRQELIACLLEHCPEEKQDWLRNRLEYPDEVSLIKRIKGFIQPFKEFIGNSRERNKLAYKISVTRNYLTHYNRNLESEAAKGNDLYVLCLKMELLFELHFLKLTGFTPEKIKSIADNCPKLQWKRSSSLSGH